MKKNTFYALLCTTIMISGVSLATDNDGTPKTPVAKFKQKQEDKTPLTPVRSIEQKLLALPKTPTQAQAEEKYLYNHSPFTASRHAKFDISEIKVSNAAYRMELTRQLEEEKYKKERVRLKEKQDECYNILLEEKKKEKEAEEQKNTEIEKMRLREESIRKELGQKKVEIEAMEKALAESQAATEKQRSQKIDFLAKADEVEEKLTKKLQETEENYKILTAEHYKVKIELDYLTFEKETKQKVEGEMKLESNGQQNNSNPKKEPAHVPNNLPLVPQNNTNSGTQATVPTDSTAQTDELDEFSMPTGVDLTGKK